MALKPNGATMRVAKMFLAMPLIWIDYKELGKVGGFGGWRTRISNCRKKLKMRIENRPATTPDGRPTSEYCYFPATN